MGAAFAAGLATGFFGATGFDAAFTAGLGAAFGGALTAGLAAAFGAALDFVAGFGLEAAAAGFGLAAALGLDGALAMNSPTPRFSWLMLAAERAPAHASSRHDSGV
ncbi:MAG: hypothetical protein ACXW3O_14900 [Brevundimonas sp.]